MRCPISMEKRVGSALRKPIVPAIGYSISDSDFEFGADSEELGLKVVVVVFGFLS